MDRGYSRDTVEFHATVRQEDGSYWAEVDELPGCFASGRSLDELREAVTEAIALYLADDTSGAATAEDFRVALSA